ncbi:MAG: glycosyltransferase [Ginsengibacter sp.]
MAISIGLPFYNAEEFLADAVRSVFAQTYTDWELILMDDGSTDGSLQIARSIKDPRVRVYSDGMNKKLATRLNEVAHLARYEFLARMDADDLMSPVRLEKQLHLLMANPAVDLVTTGVFSITDDLKLVGMRGMNADSASLKELLHRKVGFTHAAVLGRRAWFLRNPYNTSLKIAQDHDLWLRSSSKNDFSVLVISDPLYYYREGRNVTVKKILAAHKNERLMFKRYAGKDYLFLLLKSYSKSFVVGFLAKIGKTDILLKRRNIQHISSQMLELFERELKIIISTEVPGMEFRKKKILNHL